MTEALAGAIAVLAGVTAAFFWLERRTGWAVAQMTELSDDSIQYGYAVVADNAGVPRLATDHAGFQELRESLPPFHARSAGA